MAESESKRLRTLGEVCESGTDAAACHKCGCRDWRRIGQTDKEICRHCGQSVRTRPVKPT